MAGKYDVNEVIELLFDEEFGQSGSEISEEEREDAHCWNWERPSEANRLVVFRLPSG